MSLKESLTAVADSIRKKTNTTDKMTIAEMPALIDSLKNFEGITGLTLDVTKINNEQFKNGHGLEGIKTLMLPNVEVIGFSAFDSAYKIETIDIGENVTGIHFSAFDNCFKLTNLIFRGLWLAGSLGLLGTPIHQKNGGYIYVPDEYLEQYKSADNWQRFASQIKPLSEYYGIEASSINPEWTDWRWFSYENNRNDLVLKLKYDDTKNGEDFSDFCLKSDKLTYIPDINTSKGKYFSNALYACHELIKSPNIDTSEGLEFDYMYNCCCKMVDTPKLNTPKGTNFKYMYWNCQVMKDPLEQSVPCGTDFEGFMFNCYAVPKITLTNMNTDIVENSVGMFNDCNAATEISGAVMGRNGGAAWMFRSCDKLQTVKGFKINPSATKGNINSTVIPKEVDVWTHTFEWCGELVNLEMIGENKWPGLNLKYSKKLSKESLTNVINTLSDSVTIDENTGDLDVTLSIDAINNAFDGGIFDPEWKALIATKPNWTIAMIK